MYQCATPCSEKTNASPLPMRVARGLRGLGNWEAGKGSCEGSLGECCQREGPRGNVPKVLGIP